MDLPKWDEQTCANFRKRWDATNRAPASPKPEKEGGPTPKFEPEPPDEVDWAALVMGPELTYTDVYDGLSHLLYTQEGNRPHESLIHFLDGEDNRNGLYHEITFRKKRGGERTLAVPSHPLKWLQRSLLLVLTHLFPRHKCAHGFERGKSIITHASQHVGRNTVYTLDIKDFFPSITRARIFGMLRAAPFKASTAAARYLANLTCYKGALPQGAPTSPILSNLICRRLDSRLFKWARTHGYVYSRYADDLTFSTNRDAVPPAHLTHIDEIITSEGFEVNEEKRRQMPRTKRQMVTGLVVNEKLNLPREKLRGLRALLHNIEAHGWESQIGRKAYYDDAEDWRAYISGSLSAKEYEYVIKEQQEKHALINPAAVISGVSTVAGLRQHLQGKIAFVGTVRGDEDEMYQRLSTRFNALTGRYADFKDAERRGARRVSQQISEADADLVPQSEEDVPRYYRQFKVWKQKQSKGELSLNELKEKLSGWTDRSLEMAWHLKREIKEQKFIAGAAKIAYALDTKPWETARFFRLFDEDLGFRGLLHQPTPDFPNPGEIIGACREHLGRYTLPNGIREALGKVVDQCKKWIEAHPGHYPWEDEKLREDVLLPLKKDIQFKPREGMDLLDRLQDVIEDSEATYDVNIEVKPRRGQQVRTHVPSVLPAIETLVRSMAEHSRTRNLTIDTELIKEKNEVILKLFDGPGGHIEGPTDLSELFTGDTRRALYSQTGDTGLRGYARWTFIAPHEDGNIYEFDVMTNTRSVVEREYADGVMHRITFYR